MSSDTRPRSAPHTGQSVLRPASKKVFNCIVDDTALVAGVKRSTRNGLRQWVKNGQIRLFVPLYALEQLNCQKGAPTRHGEDVLETLEWLDQATTKYPDAIALQGGDEVFESWAEVEQFAVPRSLFSEADDHETPTCDGEQLSLSDDLTGLVLERHESRSCDSQGDPDQSAAGSALDNDKLEVGSHVKMPVAMRPLFNYILWRIHQEHDPVAALESFIFLCNDPLKAHLAKGFEVRCKRLEQLRDTIGREERETRNRQITQHRSTQSVEAVYPADSPSTPPTAPAAMLKPPTKLIDPDTFGRVPTTHHQNKNSPARGPSSNQRVDRDSIRGSTESPKLLLSSPKHGTVSRSARGRGGPRASPAIDSEIDPNSFERPRGAHTGRGGRQLWSPN